MGQKRSDNLKINQAYIAWFTSPREYSRGNHSNLYNVTKLIVLVSLLQGAFNVCISLKLWVPETPVWGFTIFSPIPFTIEPKFKLGNRGFLKNYTPVNHSPEEEMTSWGWAMPSSAKAGAEGWKLSSVVLLRYKSEFVVYLLGTSTLVLATGTCCD